MKDSEIPFFIIQIYLPGKKYIKIHYQGLENDNSPNEFLPGKNSDKIGVPDRGISYSVKCL
jgi:hypothetical protein